MELLCLVGVVLHVDVVLHWLGLPLVLSVDPEYSWQSLLSDADLTVGERLRLLLVMMTCIQPKHE